MQKAGYKLCTIIYSLLTCSLALQPASQLGYRDGRRLVSSIWFCLTDESIIAENIAEAKDKANFSLFSFTEEEEEISQGGLDTD